MGRQTTPDLADADAAYVAGIIDGEGTVTLTRRSGSPYRTVVVSVSNTDERLLRGLRQMVGAGKITRKRTVSPRHTPSGTWMLDGRRALHLLHRVVPHLRTYKRERAELLLREYLAHTPRNGKYDPAMHAAKKDFEDRFFAICPGRGIAALPGDASGSGRKKPG